MDVPERRLGTAGQTKSAFESGKDDYQEQPLRIGFMFVALVLFTILVESVLHHLNHTSSKTASAFLAIVYNEIMILGLISLALFFVQDARILQGEAEAGLGVFHFLHVAVFLIAIMYIVAMASLWRAIKNLSHQFSAHELYAVTMVEVEPRGGGSATPSGLIPRTKEPLVRVVERKLAAYKAWVQKAPLLEQLWNPRLHLLGIHWSRIVAYHTLRTAFLLQCMEDAELKELVKSGFQFARFLRKRLRQEVLHAAHIGRTSWATLAGFVAINMARIAATRDRLPDGEAVGTPTYAPSSYPGAGALSGTRLLAGGDAEDDDGGSSFEDSDLNVEIAYWTVVLYLLLLLLAAALREVRSVYRVFKHRSQEDFKSASVLESFGEREAAAKARLRGALRMQAQQDDFLASQYPKFCNRHHAYLALIKTVTLTYCWVVMLYCLVFCKHLLIAGGPGLLVLVSLVMALPPLAAFSYLIPQMVLKSGVLLAAADLTHDREAIKALIEKTNAGDDTGLRKAKRRIRGKRRPRRQDPGNAPSRSGGGAPAAAVHRDSREQSRGELAVRARKLAQSDNDADDEEPDGLGKQRASVVRRKPKRGASRSEAKGDAPQLGASNAAALMLYKAEEDLINAFNRYVSAIGRQRRTELRGAASSAPRWSSGAFADTRRVPLPRHRSLASVNSRGPSRTPTHRRRISPPHLRQTARLCTTPTRRPSSVSAKRS